jgi:hypothetical protein
MKCMSAVVQSGSVTEPSRRHSDVRVALHVRRARTAANRPLVPTRASAVRPHPGAWYADAVRRPTPSCSTYVHSRVSYVKRPSAPDDAAACVEEVGPARGERPERLAVRVACLGIDRSAVSERAAPSIMLVDLV